MKDIIIFKELMEREEYENISLVAKIAYGIYVSMLEDYENVKKDENGVRYITDGRKTLEEILKISPVTMTKIHKELVDAELIVEKHQGVSKPLATYINNYETLELEKTQENDEMKEIGELLKSIKTSNKY